MKRLSFLLMLASLSAVAHAQTSPTPTANSVETLGRELAEQGMLAQLLPMVAMKEAEELIAGMPDLTDAEKGIFRATARENYEAVMARVVATQGKIYAEKLSEADLRTLVDFNRGQASKRYQTVMPQVIESTVRSLEGVDFKGETMKAFCAKTGKGCKPAK